MFPWFKKLAAKEEHPVVRCARDYARLLRHNYINVEHILLGVLSQKGGAVELLGRHGLDRSAALAAVIRIVGKGSEDTVMPQQLPLTPRARRVCQSARDAASRLGATAVEPIHFLLAMIVDGRSVATMVLEGEFEIRLDDLKRQIETDGREREGE